MPRVCEVADISQSCYPTRITRRRSTMKGERRREERRRSLGGVGGNARKETEYTEQQKTEQGKSQEAKKMEESLEVEK